MFVKAGHEDGQRARIAARQALQDFEAVQTGHLHVDKKQLRMNTLLKRTLHLLTTIGYRCIDTDWDLEVNCPQF